MLGMISRGTTFVLVMLGVFRMMSASSPIFPPAPFADPPSTSTSTSASVVSVPDPRSVTSGLLRSENSPCPDADWMYSNRTGFCYMFKEGMHTFNDGRQLCQCLKAELLRIEDQNEQEFVDDTLMQFTYADHWLNAEYQIGVGNGGWQWPNNTKIYNEARWIKGEPKTESGSCAMIRRSLTGKWEWMTAECGEKKCVFCRVIATRCPPVSDFKADYVVAVPARAHIELTVKFHCEKGYVLPNYTKRYEDWKKAKAENTTQDPEPKFKETPVMEAHCGKNGSWQYSGLPVAPCEPEMCADIPTIEHAVRNVTVKRIKYPAYVNYTCKHGYMFNDLSQKWKVGYCASDDHQWRQMDGVLRLRTKMPASCDRVRCGVFEAPASLNAYREEREFYGEVRAYRCPEGEMYPDKSIWRFVKCARNFVNELEGRWNDSDLPECEPLRCPTPQFEEPEHTLLNISAAEFQNSTWKHKAYISYYCADGYEFADSSTTLTSHCTENAVWKPPISNCIERPNKKFKIVGRRYVPQPVEAEEAQNIGSVAMLFVVIMFSVIILLDVTSLVRDLKRMKSNLRHFTRKFTHPPNIIGATPTENAQ